METHTSQPLTVTPLPRAVELQRGKKPSDPAGPLAMRVAQTAFGSLGDVAPEVMAKVAYRLWFAPRRYTRPAREKALLAKSEHMVVSTVDGGLSAHVWGPELMPWESRSARNTVLLMHGWEGRGSQLGAFVEPLVARGYQVVALDAVGHGNSPGERAHIWSFARGIRAVERQMGPLHAVIAHSMGGGATGVALSQGLDVGRVVLLGAPSRLADVVARTVATLKLTPATQAIFLKLMEEEFGQDMWEAANVGVACSNSGTPGLLVHDVDDAEVPYQDAVANAAAWPGARLVTTAGLGHRRILWDGPVVEEVLRFVDGERALPLHS